jgi:hypothetical protein
MKMTRNEREFHRKTAAQSFNSAWDYLDKKKRTPEESREMLRLAHTSRHHWGLVGSPRNRAVGDWQISRVYAELSEPRLALLFAESCLGICEDEGLDEIVHTANEAMARAYGVSGDFKRARKHLKAAKGQLALLELDKEDRAIFAGQIRETELLIESAEHPRQS